VNVPPNTGKSDRDLGQLRQAAARWLTRNDPDIEKNKRIAKLRKQRAARQTRVHRLR
jgi:hypothetical protein